MYRRTKTCKNVTEILSYAPRIKCISGRNLKMSLNDLEQTNELKKAVCEFLLVSDCVVVFKYKCSTGVSWK